MSVSDFQILTNFENLYASYKASMKGRRRSADALRFESMAMEGLYMIQQQLRSHTYQIAPYHEFMVSEPKPRRIMSGAFRDKVLQHCLCDYVLLPKLKSVFILDNYAGQTGKGTLFGLNRLSSHLSRYYEQYGADGYILKCDISKFFYSITTWHIIETEWCSQSVRMNLILMAMMRTDWPFGCGCGSERTRA